MANIIEELEAAQVAKLVAVRLVPEFQPGDTLVVNVKVKEGERTRVQAYEGVCIARTGGGLNESFTVRKISYGEGVERVFPVYSPKIDSIKVSAAARCAAPSSITCATGAARPPVSPRRWRARRQRPRARPPMLRRPPSRRAPRAEKSKGAIRAAKGGGKG